MNTEVKAFSCIDLESKTCIVVFVSPFTEYVVRRMSCCSSNLDVPYFVIAVCCDNSVFTVKCKSVFAVAYKTDSLRRTVNYYLNVSV